jgi:hypothetical protein
VSGECAIIGKFNLLILKSSDSAHYSRSAAFLCRLFKRPWRLIIQKAMLFKVIFFAGMAKQFELKEKNGLHVHLPGYT